MSNSVREYYQPQIEELQRKYDNAIRLSFQYADYLQQAARFKQEIEQLKIFIKEQEK